VSLGDNYLNFPVVKQYEYLGLLIEADTNLKVAAQQLKHQETQLNHLISMVWAARLPRQMRFELWRQNVISRFMYAKVIAADTASSVKDQLKGFLYRSMKKLLTIRYNT
jgi:hypothetical protein